MVYSKEGQGGLGVQSLPMLRKILSENNCDNAFQYCFIYLRNMGTGSSGSNVLPRVCNLRKVPFDVL